MTQEHTLDELKKFAHPALRHAELIEIARTKNPSDAQRAAEVRWPRRQAKAARFLAMMHRDYGNDAFEAFVASTDRARSPQSGVEHVRGDRDDNDRS